MLLSKFLLWNRSPKKVWILVQEKHLKQKVQDEVAKAIIAKNGASLSVSEHEALVSQIKKEAAQAHAEMMEAIGMVSKSMGFLIYLLF